MSWLHPVEHRINGIDVTLKREDVPEFRRSYKTQVGDGFTVEVTMVTSSLYLGRRDRLSQLTQKNGKYILFDARSVADKIIDRELYPLVQAVVDTILAMDAEYIASNPTEFIDETGAIWRKV